MSPSSSLSPFRHKPIVKTPGDEVLEQILREIMVPAPHLDEAKRRRQLVCDLAMRHPAARAYWFSGSIAHGTENAPLGDADCGVMINRRYEQFRAFGPDAGQGGKGPEEFIQSFASFIEPQLADGGYPQARIDLSGNRAIKIEFNDPIDLDELGIVDPFVELIIGLDRRDAPGIWIPDRRRNSWDPANPQRHTEMMTEEDPQALVVHRAHVIRLEKRAVKREQLRLGRGIICSWNLSALALDYVVERERLAVAVSQALSHAAASIEIKLTEDPAGIAGEIRLPEDADQAWTANRLAAMADLVGDASEAASIVEARRILSPLFGVEIDSIRERERTNVRREPLNDALRSGNTTKISGALGSAALLKPVRSDGDWHG